MDLSMSRASDSNVYIHKKFRQMKRSHDEDAIPDWQQINAALLVGPRLYMPYNFIPTAERPTTPFCTDYASFAANYNATSTPYKKRLCLQADRPIATINLSIDSSIALRLNSSSPAAAAVASTTANGESIHYQLRRQLPASKLPQAPLIQSNIAEEPVGGRLTPEKISNTSEKHKHTNQNRKAIKRSIIISVPSAITKARTTRRGVLEINANVIKSVLKPTPVGTLELPAAAATSDAAPSADPMTTAAVLTSISEDKLRSICTYHTNMVRKFPKKVRTPKDQERRNKNTIACRMSRRVKKLQDIAIEEQCRQSEMEQWRIHEECLRATALLEVLEQLIISVREDEVEIDVVNVEDEAGMVILASDMLRNENARNELKSSTAAPTGCHSFTIANILGE